MAKGKDAVFKRVGAAGRYPTSTLNDSDRNNHLQKYSANKHDILTHLLINILAQSGDIETHPGPSACINRNNHTKNKKCEKCATVTRYRRFLCVECKQTGPSMCPFCLTDELVTHYNKNNVIREYKCEVCIRISDLSKIKKNGETNSPLPRPAQGLPTVPCDNKEIRSTNSSNKPQNEKKGKIMCNYCQTIIKTANKKRPCNKCKSIFHPYCYKKVSINDQLCNICLSSELPFYTFNEYSENDTIILEQSNINENTNSDIPENSLINPSEAPDDFFDCLKGKGMHFVHINARSMLHKLTEIQYIADKSKPAIISITETWLGESHANDEVIVKGYKITRRDRGSHAGSLHVHKRRIKF